MNFKTTATAAALVLAPFAAKAGNLSEPIQPSIVPTLAPTSTTTDWSGAYVGLSYGFASGDYDFTLLNGDTRDMDDGSLTQLFADTKCSAAPLFMVVNWHSVQHKTQS